MAERRVVIETQETLPSHSDRIEVKVSIPSSEGLLPLKLYGQVSRTKPANSQRSASFWVLITKVDECGRPGLFANTWTISGNSNPKIPKIQELCGL